MKQYGLIGFPLSHSFSPGYFANKFEKEGIQDASYEAFPIERIELLSSLLKEKSPLGLNVTIPYKEQVIPLLDDIDDLAKRVGAVNTLLYKDGKLKGYNSDVIGFGNSLQPLLKPNHTKALILGTGGAAKAVQVALEELGISYQYVSRQSNENVITYNDIDEELLNEYHLIIHTTPLGMYPNTDAKPDLPYDILTSDHLLFDLVYNPEKTAFLLEGEQRGAQIKNGLEMLHLQAEASWEIWQENH